jgi:hypothetical protein
VRRRLILAQDSAPKRCRWSGAPTRIRAGRGGIHASSRRRNRRGRFPRADVSDKKIAAIAALCFQRDSAVSMMGILVKSHTRLRRPEFVLLEEIAASKQTGGHPRLRAILVSVRDLGGAAGCGRSKSNLGWAGGRGPTCSRDNHAGPTTGAAANRNAPSQPGTEAIPCRC